MLLLPSSKLWVNGIATIHQVTQTGMLAEENTFLSRLMIGELNLNIFFSGCLKIFC